MSAHILDAYWEDGRFRILIRENDHVQDLPWDGPIRWHIEGPAVCVGRFEDGQHIPCPTQAETGRFDQCSACNPLERPECIFEPRCKADTSQCVCPWAQQEHVVYLAMHGHLPKVGMTKRKRVTQRLTEQGADAYVVLASANHRVEARRIEKQVAILHSAGKNRIPEYRTYQEILPQWAKPRDDGAILEALTQWMERLRPRYPDLEEPVLLEHPFLPRPLPASPQFVQVHGDHKGRALGVKGNYLVYEASPQPGTLMVGLAKVHALRRHDLIGRFLDILS